MNAEYNIDRIIKEQYVSNIINGILVEVGAAHPELLSFSKLFRDDGWRCISIEPNPYFAEKHKEKNHEIYQYACADYYKDNADFQVVEDFHPKDSLLTYESFSSIKIKQEYFDKDGVFPYKTIKVNIRPLDLILEEAKLEQEIDVLIIDTEGWELEVMKGFNHTKYNPKVIVLENYLYLESYNEYMDSIGYKLNGNMFYNYVYIKK
jgi:FkbM family methyltransferase